MPRLALLLATACSWSPAASPGSDPTPIRVQDAREAATASNRFGFDLYARLAAGDGNRIVSPLSASVALSMTAAGAGGETLAQMSRVLHVSGMEDAHRSFGELLKGFAHPAPGDEVDGDAGSPAEAGAQPSDDVGPLLERARTLGQPEVSVANRIWAQSGLRLRDEYISLLRERYGVSLGLADFAHAHANAKDEINHWVDAQTRHRIPELLPGDAIDEFVRLVLVNAVYFKGDWQSPFPVAETRPQDFWVRKAVQVPMMRQLASFAYAQLDDVRLVELPYVGGRYSMVVVLPDDQDGLSRAEDRIGRSYDRWLAALKGRDVDLWLPRWTARQTLNLNAVLSAMGMPLAFDSHDRADFSGMTGDSSLYISLVIQKAFVEAVEKGTEAAAATAVVMSVPVMAVTYAKPPPPPVVFHADHPFLYVIRDRTTGAILFVGRVVDPR